MKGFRRRIQDSADGPATYVAAGAKFRGLLAGKGSYIFCGEFEGDCDIDGPVTLGEGGLWTGTLKARNVIIAGTVIGDVIAEERVEIGRTARIAGSLSGHSIAVAEGAVIEGELRITSGQEPTHFEERRNVVAHQGSNAA
jgi:cytoskeletal protein CcmA (bactofilin family)